MSRLMLSPVENENPIYYANNSVCLKVQEWTGEELYVLELKKTLQFGSRFSFYYPSLYRVLLAGAPDPWSKGREFES